MHLKFLSATFRTVVLLKLIFNDIVWKKFFIGHLNANMKSDTRTAIKYNKRRIYRMEISFHADRINDRENKEILKNNRLGSQSFYITALLK